MKTYIPSEEELVELGFIKIDFKTYWQTNLSEKLAISYMNSFNVFHLCHDDGEYLKNIKFIPTSKEHLESIILAFKPL